VRTSRLKKDPQLAVFIILLAALATIIGAWAFQEHGYTPCELCLKERIPYYTGILVAAAAIVFAEGGKREFLRPALIALCLIFLVSAAFGIYHAGVEWGFWPGPAECTGSFEKAKSPADFLRQLENIRVVRCDEAAVRILGLSLAGWNAVISLALAALAFIALRTKKSR
jgi:disulfide bond formation protein DsbB